MGFSYVHLTTIFWASPLCHRYTRIEGILARKSDVSPDLWVPGYFWQSLQIWFCLMSVANTFNLAPFFFVWFPFSLSPLASTSDLPRWEFHFASQPTAPKFNHGSCAWYQMETKAHISCTQEWRGQTTRWSDPRVVLKWLGILSSLQGISNLSNILFHKLQCRQIFEQN